jgi:hsp70-interacting protein
MESLLHWSIAHTDPNAPPPDPERMRHLDPAIIDQILGKPDAVMMKEALEKAVDTSLSEDDRVSALDDFEMVRHTRIGYAEFILINT